MTRKVAMNVLLVEDQKRLAQALSAILEEEGYHVDAVSDGRSGLDYALGACRTKTPYDAIVLDVMLPLMDGFTVARELRREHCDTPVIMLTARDTLRDKVTGLDAGADDYLIKPFQPAELLARLRALTRRGGTVRVESVAYGNTTLDLQSADLCRNAGETDAGATEGAADKLAGEPTDTASERAAGKTTGNSKSGGGGNTAPTSVTSVHLSQREFELCRLFMANPGQTLTKANLLARIWGLDTDADENSVEAYVSFLRKKLSYLTSDLRIVTVRGMGYRLEIAKAESTRNVGSADAC
jgi:DNA-binding response OmpR family regulator